MAALSQSRFRRPNPRYPGYRSAGDTYFGYDQQEKEEAKKRRKQKQTTHDSLSAVEGFTPASARLNNQIDGGTGRGLGGDLDEDFDPGDYNEYTAAEHDDTKGSDEDESDSCASQSDDGIFCTQCLSGKRSRTLLQCSGCAEWMHADCHEKMSNTTLNIDFRDPSSIDKFVFYCRGEDVCRVALQKMVKSGYVYESSEDSDREIENHEDIEGESPPSAMSCENQSQESKQFQSKKRKVLEALSNVDDDSQRKEIPLRAATHQFLCKAHSRPILFACLSNWNLTGHSLQSTVVDQIGDAIIQNLQREGFVIPDQTRDKVLGSVSPPASIRRVLHDCSTGLLEYEILRVQFKKRGIEATFKFWYRNPTMAALDLFYSSRLRNKGPMTNFSDIRCNTGREPDVHSKLKAMADAFGFDPNNKRNETMIGGLYSDDAHSASGNVIFSTFWLANLSHNLAVRSFEGVDSHVLVALGPTKNSIEFRSLNGQATSIIVTKSLLKDALQELRVQAMQILLKKICETEVQGVQVEFDGVDRYFRLLIAWISTDMKERRVWLGLRENKYHCMHCYAFPGKPFSSDNPDTDDDEDGSQKNGRKIGTETLRPIDIDPGQLRNPELDAKMRSSFEAEYTYQDIQISKDKAFNEIYGRFGVPRKDRSPFTKQAGSLIFSTGGPASIFPMDALHNKDGVVLYSTEYAAQFIGDDFISVSQHYGNEYLHTNKLGMHVMEKALISAHYIPLAIFYGDFQKPLTDDNRKRLCLGFCDLLEILALIEDPCPGFILDTLRMAVTRFKDFIVWLTSEIGRTMTTKMHELFEHVCDDLAKFGIASGFSTKLFETFHEVVKDLYGIPSRRIQDGSAHREILELLFFRFLAKELEPDYRIAGNSHQEYLSSARFEVANDRPKVAFRSLLFDNVTRLLQVVFAGRTAPRLFQRLQSERFVNIGKFGSTLTFWIHCQVRNLPESQKTTVRVPGSCESARMSGGAYHAIAFYKQSVASPTPVSPRVDCPRPGCSSRHHDVNFQLHVTAARDGETGYALPVLFAGAGCYAIPLRVCEEDSKFPKHAWLFEVEASENPHGELDLIFIDYNLFRGVCMFKPSLDSQGKLGHVWRGRRVFGHKVQV